MNTRAATLDRQVADLGCPEPAVVAV